MRLSLAFFLFLFYGIAAAEFHDWPMWRSDPGRSAFTTEQLADNLYLQWRVQYDPRISVWDDPLNQDLMQFDKFYEPVVQKSGSNSYLLTQTPVGYSVRDIYSSQGTDIQVTSFDEHERHPSVAVDANGNPLVVYGQESSDFNSRVILQRSFDKGLIWPEDHLLFVAGNEKFSAICPELDTIAGGTRALITFLGNRDPNVYFFDIVNIDDPISMIIGGFNLSDRTQYIFETSIAGYGETGGILGVIIDYKKGGYEGGSIDTASKIKVHRSKRICIDLCAVDRVKILDFFCNRQNFFA